MNDLFTWAEAEKERDAGMARAAEHANGTVRGWTERAYDFLVSYAQGHEFFISENVSNASKDADFPQPPTDRAWGSVYRRAIKEQVIARHGEGRSSRRHASICPRWRSLVYGARS